MKPAWFLLLFLLASAAPPAGAAVVRLKDGGRIEGSVISATPQEVVIQTAGGSRRIDAALVQTIEYEPSALPPAPSKFSPGWSGEPYLPAAGRNLFSFGLGLAAPLSDVDFGSIGGGSASNGDFGPLLGVRYLRAVTNRLAAGLDLDYLHRAGTNSPGLLPLANSSVSGDNLLILALARWYLIERGFARPYLLGGAGVSRSWMRVEAEPIRGFAWTDTNTDESRRLVDDSAWALAATARLGIDFNWDVTDPAVFGIEAGWTALKSRRYGATRSGQDLGLDSVTGRLNLFTLATRWSWR